MAAPAWPDDSIFEPFNIVEVVYKKHENHELKTAILIPKSQPTGQHPVIINLHGGFLINGYSTFAPFFAPWVIQLALKRSAMIVSPDYRLLPSNNGAVDILEDLHDFWQWTRTELKTVLHETLPGHVADLQQTLLVGGSAGGYCAIQLALSYPNEISVLAMSYPEVDVRDDIFVKGPADDEPTILRNPKADMPSKQAVLEWIDECKKTITSRAGFERAPFAIATAQYGLYYSHVFDPTAQFKNADLPLERISSGAELPRKIWVIHGDDDSVVHIRGTRKFVDLVLKNCPSTTIRLDVAKGQDHAFDHLNFDTWDTFIDGHAAMDFVLTAWGDHKDTHSVDA